MTKRRKGKNSLIDNISAQAAVQQESAGVSCQISVNNELLESKSEYENLTEELAKIPDLNPEFAADTLAIHKPKDEDEIDDLEYFAQLKDFETAMSDLSTVNMKLKSENAALQEENDKYLMKISELTFENAKLNAQLQELSKNANAVNNNSTLKFNERTIPNMIDSSKKQSTRHSAKKVYYPYKADNIGYTSWN